MFTKNYKNLNYALITPVKNEEINLINLSDVIIKQSILPIIWVIINDYSEDNTGNIIKQLMKKYSWIECINIKKSKVRNLDEKFAKICNLGFRYAISKCIEKKIEIKYLIKVDADMIFENTCIEKMLTEFENDKKLGIASPTVIDISQKSLIDKIKNDLREGKKIDPSIKQASFRFHFEPSDGLRLYKKQTYEEIGGIPITKSPDTVVAVKSKFKNWESRQIDDVIAISIRETGSTVKNTFRLQGSKKYYLNYNPIIIIFYFFLLTSKSRIKDAFSFLSGFLIEFFRHGEKIKDQEVKKYFCNERLIEIIKYILRRTVLNT